MTFTHSTDTSVAAMISFSDSLLLACNSSDLEDTKSKLHHIECPVEMLLAEHALDQTLLVSLVDRLVEGLVKELKVFVA
jgi:hypothetical protein